MTERRSRAVALAAWALVALLVAAVAGWLVVRGGVPGSVVGGVGALRTDDAGSCAETYDEQSLARRAFAADATVAAIEPGGQFGTSRVTFTVHEWFRGGSGPQLVADVDPPLPQGAGSSVGGPAYGVGTRLLVSGEPRWGGPALQDAVVWAGCGFTRYHDAVTAGSWRQVFADGA